MWRECNSSTLEIIPHSGILQELELKENRERQVRGSKQSWRDLFLSSGLPNVPGPWREWCQMVTTRRNWEETSRGEGALKSVSEAIADYPGNQVKHYACKWGWPSWMVPKPLESPQENSKSRLLSPSRHAESEWGGEAKDGALGPCQALFRVLTVLGTISMATNVWFNTSAFFLTRYWSL